MDASFVALLADPSVADFEILHQIVERNIVDQVISTKVFFTCLLHNRGTVFQFLLSKQNKLNVSKREYDTRRADNCMIEFARHLDVNNFLAFLTVHDHIDLYDDLFFKIICLTEICGTNDVRSLRILSSIWEKAREKDLCRLQDMHRWVYRKQEMEIWLIHRVGTKQLDWLLTSKYLDKDYVCDGHYNLLAKFYMFQKPDHVKVLLLHGATLTIHPLSHKNIQHLYPGQALRSLIMPLIKDANFDLFFGVTKTRKEQVVTAFQNGADPNFTDFDNRTLLSLTHDRDIRSLIVAHGIDIQRKFRWSSNIMSGGVSVLSFAITHDQALFELLCKHQRIVVAHLSKHEQQTIGSDANLSTSIAQHYGMQDFLHATAKHRYTASKVQQATQCCINELGMNKDAVGIAMSYISAS